MRDKNRKRLTSIVQRNNRIRRRREYIKKLVARSRDTGAQAAYVHRFLEANYGLDREVRTLATPLPPESQVQLEQQIAEGKDLHSIVGGIFTGHGIITGRLKSRQLGFSRTQMRRLVKNINFAAELKKSLDRM